MIPYFILVIENDADREFMTLLYVEYHRHLYEEIYRILKNTWNTEDVLQATMVKLIDKIPELRNKSRSNLIGYITIVAKHNAYSFLRSQKKDPLPFEDYLEQSEQYGENRQIELHIIEKEIIEKLIHNWPKLDERIRYLLEGKYILGKSDEDLAKELSIKPSSIRMALTRARQCAYNLLVSES